MSPYDGLPQAAFSSPGSRGSVSSLHSHGGTRHFTTFPPGLSSLGPPDHFESLLLEKHCAQFGFWVGEKFLPIPFLVQKRSPLSRPWFGHPHRTVNRTLP